MSPTTRAVFRLLPGLAVCLVACGDNESLPKLGGTFVIIDAPVMVCDGSVCFDTEEDDVRCGDGIASERREGCDDGNLIPGDGCSDICQREICGNGILDLGEACDPPDPTFCNDRCGLIIQTCGNKQIEVSAGEQCDDGNPVKGDGCYNCLRECGDGVLDRQIGEECEPIYTPVDGAGVSATCTATCRRKPFCGDGKVDTASGEQCDPVNGSTCIDNCRLAANQGAGEVCKPTVNDGGVSTPAVENLVPNGTFDSDTAGWLPGPNVDVQFAMGQGAAKPGSARVSFKASLSAPTFSIDGIERCVAISAGDTYAFEASYLNSIGQPAGTRAFAVVLLYPTSDCSGQPATAGPGAAPTSPQAGKWLPYRLNIDATSIGSLGASASVSIKLGVIVAPGQTGMAFWDDATLRSGSFNPNCGNCVVDDGETCDDGNRIRGDGCNATCRIEGAECGNGKIDVGEACDTGSTTYSAAANCTPLCTTRSPCDECSLVGCRAQFSAALEVPGVAAAGPGKGVARNILAGRLRQCVARSGCAGDTAVSSKEGLGGQGAFIENCYCGTSGKECLIPGLANGSCKNEIEAALETREASTVISRIGGAVPEYPIFAAVKELHACETANCPSQCSSTLSCGNGIVQERTSSFADTFLLPIGRKGEKCVDSLTPSGRGCSFEECDGQIMCDPDCFLLQCGNRLKQTGEDCDDGNTMSGDGCSATCKAEFVCGDDKVATEFGEQCDPPNSGKNCSMAEFMSTPTGCGCGSTCEYKVCGNNIVQDGEQCDPPNGTTCGPDCKVAGLGECIECMLLAGDSDDAPYKTLLQGNKEIPELETGCIDTKECFDLLNCHVNNHCFLQRSPPNTLLVDCYCGLDTSKQDPADCEKPDFVPVGPCASKFKAAYEKQTGLVAENKGIVEGFYAPPPSGKPGAMFNAVILLDSAVGTGNPHLLPAHLKAAGVDDAKIKSCMNACYGPE